jgi:hypothetical protein
MNDADKVLKTLRTMAWSRVKGELNAILDTYYGEYNAFGKMDELITNFIKEVEDAGCQQ